jgi:hypothetical protein
MSEASIVKDLHQILVETEDYAKGTSFASNVDHEAKLILHHDSTTYTEAATAANKIAGDCMKLEQEGHGNPPVSLYINDVRELQNDYHYYPNPTVHGAASLDLSATTDHFPIGGSHT